MKTRIFKFFSILTLAFACVSSLAHATLFEQRYHPTHYSISKFQKQSDEAEATDLIATLQTLPDDLATRLDFASKYFLGRPYLVGGPLGEGPNAEYDQDPLFRMDGFDCTTYVETMNALARAQDFPSFLDILMRIRYLNGDISFTTRNHFVELDWNPNNIAAGFFQDFTSQIGQSTDVTNAVQNFGKKTWYETLPASAIHIDGAIPEVLSALLDQLHHEGDDMPNVVSTLPYVLKNSLLSARVKSTMPTPGILNIVRDEPFPTATSFPKTRMVTHQMLLFSINGALRIRQASSLSANMKIIDIAYEDYVKSLIASPITQGMNVLKILP